MTTSCKVGNINKNIENIKKQEINENNDLKKYNKLNEKFTRGPQL